MDLAKVNYQYLRHMGRDEFKALALKLVSLQETDRQENQLLSPK